MAPCISMSLMLPSQQSRLPPHLHTHPRHQPTSCCISISRIMSQARSAWTRNLRDACSFSRRRQGRRTQATLGSLLRLRYPLRKIAMRRSTCSILNRHAMPSATRFLFGPARVAYHPLPLMARRPLIKLKGIGMMQRQSWSFGTKMGDSRSCSMGRSSSMGNGVSFRSLSRSTRGSVATRRWQLFVWAGAYRHTALTSSGRRVGHSHHRQRHQGRPALCRHHRQAHRHPLRRDRPPHRDHHVHHRLQECLHHPWIRIC
mmetsp:Transcript_9626/g.21800  ORF Transcript_9626/g.21800 Transcript_9626/m.21800 type:complete len:258 (-) Transcript_9626:629-1402(-)